MTNCRRSTLQDIMQDLDDWDSFSTIKGDLGENREPVRELQAWNAWLEQQDLISAGLGGCSILLCAGPSFGMMRYDVLCLFNFASLV